jgi:hypothetical protein
MIVSVLKTMMCISIEEPWCTSAKGRITSAKGRSVIFMIGMEGLLCCEHARECDAETKAGCASDAHRGGLEISVGGHHQERKHGEDLHCSGASWWSGSASGDAKWYGMQIGSHSGTKYCDFADRTTEQNIYCFSATNDSRLLQHL